VKKDLWVKLAGLAIVLTLISSSLVSVTYAKYVKQVTGTDSVRVAKFAFKVKEGAVELTEGSTASATFDIFSMTEDTGVYNNGSSGTFIAPGTTGDFTISLENLSEVDVTAAFALTETNASSVPVYYTIDGSTQRYSGVLNDDTYDTNKTYQSMAEFAAALGTATGTLEATDGSASTSIDVKVYWTWAFESAGTHQTDTGDTALGVAAVAPTVELDVEVTVTQADT